jgi:hypothetical protein
VALNVRRSGRAAALVSAVVTSTTSPSLAARRGTAALGRRYLGPHQPAEPWSFKTLIGLPDTTLNNLVHRFDQVGTALHRRPRAVPCVREQLAIPHAARQAPLPRTLARKLQ